MPEPRPSGSPTFWRLRRYCCARPMAWNCWTRTSSRRRGGTSSRPQNGHNDPGTFTTFIGYEYTTSGPEGANLHRNVIFRGSAVPDLPFSAIDSRNPEDLWDWMDGLRALGIESLAIPHNSNRSNGMMFETADQAGRPIDAVYANQRLRNEPLVEVTQVKGTSDTHPMLSPNDEWADFGISNQLRRLAAAQPARGQLRARCPAPWAGHGKRPGFQPIPCRAYRLFGHPQCGGGLPGRQLRGQTRRGGRHAATARVRAACRYGRKPARRPPGGRPHLGRLRPRRGPGRSRIPAMPSTMRSAARRPSPPAARVSGSGFSPEQAWTGRLLDTEDAIASAYDSGVPMGSDLSPQGDAPPGFFVWALRDPDTVPLQRLQVVKGWVEDGATFEQVYDVACSDGGTVNAETHRCPDNGATVDIATCAVSEDKGASELSAVWTDPAFEPGQRAFYYARVLENPKCRWSTWDAIRAGVSPNPDMQATIQDRAWSVTHPGFAHCSNLSSRGQRRSNFHENSKGL